MKENNSLTTSLDIHKGKDVPVWSTALPNTNSIQRKKEEEKEPLQMKSNSGASNKLPEEVQAKMETSFNTDFSDVNIHNNSSNAKDLNALAYTQGTDIHFAPGQYNPESQKGQELLGHELTHVVQQRQGNVTPTTQMKGAGINDDAGLEKEADEMGKKASEGEQTNVHGIGYGIQKDTADETISEWRKSGNLIGNVPVRDEKNVPDKNVVEDFATYSKLLEEVKALQIQQKDRAEKMLVGGKVANFNFWFSKVYSLVTKHEIEYVESGAYYYPSYVLRCIKYFEKLYNDNLNALNSGGKVEEHWKSAFDKSKDSKAIYDAAEQDQINPTIGEPGEAGARAGQIMSDEMLKATSVVAALVQSMLAHIRFDLPRAEAWVFNTYYKSHTPDIDTFMKDFMTMGGVFDNAGRDMQAVIAEKGSGLAGITPKSAQDMSMRYLYNADMTKERADTWKRAEELSRLPQSDQVANPYASGNGDVGKDTTSYTDWLNKISTVPSMKDTANLPVKNSDSILNLSEQDIATLPLVERIRMIAQMLNGVTTNGPEDAILKILTATQKNKPGETVTLIDGVDPYELLHDIDFSEFVTLRFFLKSNYYANAPFVSIVRLQNTIISVIKTFSESWEGDVMLDLLEVRPDKKNVVAAAGKFQPGTNTGTDKQFWDGFDLLYTDIMKTEFQRSQLCALFGIPYSVGNGNKVPRPATSGTNNNKPNTNENNGNVKNGSGLKTNVPADKNNPDGSNQNYVNVDVTKQDYKEIVNPKGYVTIKVTEASIVEKSGNTVKVKVKLIMNDGKRILVGNNEIVLEGHYTADNKQIETQAFTIPIEYDGFKGIISFKSIDVPVNIIK